MNTTEISIEVLSGGQSVEVATSTTSVQLPVVALPAGHPVGLPVKCLLTVDQTGYIRKGANPTAVSDGTDQKVLGGNTYRVELLVGERLAIVLKTGTGTASFTPAA